MTWKRIETVEPAVVARADFLAARGLPARDPAAADPLLAIAAGAWRAMADHARSAPVEVGGLLVGEVFRDEAGRLLVDAVVAIPALGALQEAAYFRLTEAAWEHISRERAALHPDLLTVGWYHTHPGMGVFFSGTDRASQRAFFNRPWNIGLVIDPARDEVALFRGEDSERLAPTHLAVYRDGSAGIVAGRGVGDCIPAFERRGAPGQAVGRWAAAETDRGDCTAGVGGPDAVAPAADPGDATSRMFGGRDDGDLAGPDAVHAQPRPGFGPGAPGFNPGRTAQESASTHASDEAAPLAVPWTSLAALAGAALSIVFAVRIAARRRGRR